MPVVSARVTASFNGPEGTPALRLLRRKRCDVVRSGLALTLFLLNDTVLKLDRPALSAPRRSFDCSALSLAYVTGLGREMFARRPLLHRHAPEAARRLAALIRIKAPDVNAALFCAASDDAFPEAVESRLTHVEPRLLSRLQQEAAGGRGALIAVDRAVWRRLAA